MIGLLVGIVRALLWCYNLLLVVHVIFCWVNIPANKWTELLRSIVEPGLNITRKVMDRVMPKLRKPGIDWSPAVLFVAVIVIRILLAWLF